MTRLEVLYTGLTQMAEAFDAFGSLAVCPVSEAQARFNLV